MAVSLFESKEIVVQQKKKSFGTRKVLLIILVYQSKQVSYIINTILMNDFKYWCNDHHHMQSISTWKRPFRYHRKFRLFSSYETCGNKLLYYNENNPLPNCQMDNSRLSLSTNRIICSLTSTTSPPYIRHSLRIKLLFWS